MWEEERKEIIENTNEAKKAFGYCYGSFYIKLTKEDMQALLNNKCIAATLNCEEYSVFITLEN